MPEHPIASSQDVTCRMNPSPSVASLTWSWRIGPREVDTAYELITDLADRLAHRIQLTTDGNKCHLSAVDDAFGTGLDYAMR